MPVSEELQEKADSLSDWISEIESTKIEIESLNEEDEDSLDQAKDLAIDVMIQIPL